MKKEYAEEVAARIIEQLEQGTAPWQKPWKPGELKLPYNPTTGKEYRGINSLWLYMQGHSDPRWMTYKQAADEGAQVRKGQKSTHIVYWKFSEEQKVTDDQGKPVIDPETGKQKVINVQLERPRSFMAAVFNASQIDGLPPLEAQSTDAEPERHARAEAILANSGAAIHHERGDRAFYSPIADRITLPERDQFPTSDNYYATALHELGHWTGHTSRLDRDLAHPFGSEGYAREELRAEIASLMLGERLDIGHDPGQHAAYVGSWIKALKSDPKEIFRAAADAERITGYVMDFESELARSIERQPASAAVAPEVAAELQRAHENAVEGYSPLESWQMMKDEAERNGYSAKINFASGEFGEFYEITYLDKQGELSGIRTEMYGDSKLKTEYNGKRLSQFISNDDESQPAALRTAIQQHEAAKKAQQIEQQSAPSMPGETGKETPAYIVQNRRIVPENAANHAGKNAVYVQLDDGRKSWGFGVTEEEAEKSAVERAQQVGTDVKQKYMKREQPEKPMESRTYLAVPYAEKDQARALGAKWDKDAKSWYAPEGLDVGSSGLARWSLDKAYVVTAKEPQPAIEQFKEALKNAGLVLKGELVTDGKLQRVPVDGDKGGATSGAYAYHEKGRTPGGFIQNYKTGEIVHWKPEGKTPQITAEERARLATEAAQLRETREAKRSSEYEATAAAALALWNESPAATGENAYCKAKGITNPFGLRVVPDSVSKEAESHGIKIAKTAKEAKALRESSPNNRVFKAGDLLVPGMDGEGKLWTLQSINPYFKSLMKDGKKAGLFTIAGLDASHDALNNTNSPLIVAEGYATANTVSRLLGGQPVIVAFDSGNLDAVARDLRERFPARPLLFAADNDHNAEKELDANGKPKVNVGLVKATEAAKAHGGGVMAPQFKGGEKGSDWNDLAAIHGDDAARRMLADQMAIAKLDAAITAERLTTIAHTRDMDARNDPTTSADDTKVAIERGHAADLLIDAQSSLSEVRSMAADGLVGTKEEGRPVASVKTGIDQKTGAMQDQVQEERQELANRANGPTSWTKLPDQEKQALIDDVKNGKNVALPKDAPEKLKKMAGLEPSKARSRTRGVEADF